MSGNQPRPQTCCGCLFSSLFGAGFVILIYWAIFQPHHIRARVDAATLSNLTLSGNNNATTLSYHLAANLSFYNPSLRVNIYYDALYATLHFHDALLSPANDTSPTEFYQQRKRRDVVHVEFDGRAVGVAGDVAREFVKEKDEGVVNVQVWVDAQVRYKFGTVKIRQKPWIRCQLRIPVKAERGGGVDGVLGAGDQCSVKY